MAQTFLSYKKNIDVGTLKTLSELLFSLLLFSFPVFLFFVCGELFHESFNAFWSTYGWGASNNTSMLPISDFHWQVTRQPRTPRSCEREVFIWLHLLPRSRRARGWVGRITALQAPLAFPEPLERASWAVRTQNSLLAGLARRTASCEALAWLSSHCAAVRLQPTDRAGVLISHLSYFFSFWVETRSGLPLLAESHLTPSCSLQACW